MLDWDAGWVTCSTCGGKSWWRHCVTCHQQPEYLVSKRTGEPYPTQADHASCFGCGRCLPAGVRRSYCSTTCRVRVSNFYRLTAAGRRLRAEAAERARAWRAAARATFGVVGDAEKRRRLARETAEACGECGTELGADATIYRPCSGRRASVLCQACAENGEDRRRELWGYSTRYLPAAPCDSCARTVVRDSRSYQHHRRVPGTYPTRWERVAYCSDRCQRRAKGREYRARLERDPGRCEVCREPVDARRSDARYCAPACRQKAYRGRRAA